MNTYKINPFTPFNINGFEQNEKFQIQFDGDAEFIGEIEHGTFERIAMNKINFYGYRDLFGYTDYENDESTLEFALTLITIFESLPVVLRKHTRPELLDQISVDEFQNIKFTLEIEASSANEAIKKINDFFVDWIKEGKYLYDQFKSVFKFS